MPNAGFVRKEVKDKLPIWALINDCVEGSQAIKAGGTTYLPKPKAHEDASENEKLYQSYLKRAVFMNVTGRTSEAMVGQVFSKDPVTEVPEGADYLIEDTDGSGNGFDQHAKATLEQTLNVGRCGLLVDAPSLPEDGQVTAEMLNTGVFRPRIIRYEAEQIINWDEETVGGRTRLNFLVLKEVKSSRVEFEFECEPRWRHYEIDENGQVTRTVWRLEREDEIEDGEKADYVIDEEPIFINDANGQPLTEIPFYFIGSSNNDSSIDDPPLYSIADLNIAHYRNSADHEQSIFQVGQPTPVIAGLTDEWATKHLKGRVMLGSVQGLLLPDKGTYDLVQPEPNTMAKEGMEDKEDQMKKLGAKLLEPSSTSGTATEAQIENVSDNCVLSSVTSNVNKGYRSAMHMATIMVGGEQPIELFNVALNTKFEITGLNAQERQEVVAAWQAQLLTFGEVREVYRNKGIATEDDDEALELIQSEGVPSLGDNTPVN